MKDFRDTIRRFVPMAKMRQEDFKSLRNWANANAVSASAITKNTEIDTQVSGGRVIDF